jgi:peptidoglycan/xylan/chitin deacetylase (PgdA/CDA1 family)
LLIGEEKAMNRLFMRVIGVSLLVCGVLRAQELKPIYVTIRIDDIFLRESPIIPQEVDGFVEMCESHSAKVMLAVIPHRLVEDQNKNGEMVKALKRFVKRGHMIAMHSYKHQCSQCGNTAHEYNCSTDSITLPFELEARELAEGKQWLEAAIGKVVASYVCAGTDDPLHPQTLGIVKNLGFRWIADNKIHLPDFRDTLSFAPSGADYTWNIQDSAYTPMLEKAKADFVNAVAKGNYFSFVANDHFTRKNYNNGIVLKWTAEFLAFIDSFPHVAVHYVTIDDLKEEWSPQRP